MKSNHIPTTVLGIIFLLASFAYLFLPPFLGAKYGYEYDADKTVFYTGIVVSLGLIVAPNSVVSRVKKVIGSKSDSSR